MDFLDSAKVRVRSGNGGAGCVSFRREKHAPFGGPDGGDGGRGGDVWAEVAAGLYTLSAFRRQKHARARNGGHGMGRNRTGANGADCRLTVPAGTTLTDHATGTVIAELVEAGERVLLARGGAGGLGNAHFATSTNRAPRHATPGGDGVEYDVYMQLKLLADAGIVGLPNAGKSTFLRAVSNARPKVADYPFTTLHPYLGVVSVGYDELVMADIPGLIAGAHTGAGLGHRFLGHVERCAVLLHLVDGTADDVVADYQVVCHELSEHGHGLAAKPRVVCLNKIDALDETQVTDRLAALRAAGAGDPLAISAAGGEGVSDVTARVWRRVEERRRQAA